MFPMISGLYINFEQSSFVISEGDSLVVQIMANHPAGANISVSVIVSVINAAGKYFSKNLIICYCIYFQPQTTGYHTLI